MKPMQMPANTNTNTNTSTTLSKTNETIPKRNRALRLGNSIRKAGYSLNPGRNERTRTKNSNPQPPPPPTTLESKCPVPMTPISLECNLFDIHDIDCTTARPNDASTTHSSTSSDLLPTPTPTPSSSRTSFQVSNSDPSEPTTDTISSSSVSLPLTSIQPHSFSPFSTNSHFEDPPNSDPLIPSTPSFDQITLSSTSPSPYRRQQDTSTSPYHSRYPSQSILTIALAKAQTAVQLDTALQIPEAIRAYTEAVLLLEEVIDKIDVMSKDREQKEFEALMRDQTRDRIWAEDLWKRLSRGDVNDVDREEMEARLRERERKWREKQKKMEKRKKARADEEDRLIGIHNTYASRIAELQAEVLSGRLTIIDPDDHPTDPSTIPSNQSQESIKPPASPAKTTSTPNQPQPAYATLAEAERTSISSDSTTRAGTSSELQETNTSLQPATLEQLSLTNRDLQSFRKSLEIAEEEKDIVSERLPAPLHYSTSHLSNSRNRSSSSISGTSLSQLGRPQSIESITTTRTSISSKTEPWHTTKIQKPNETSQPEIFDVRKRSSISNPTVPHHRPTSHHHSARLSGGTSISVRPESLSTTTANQTIKRRSSQKLLVSDTTTQGTISQRRRSPTCLDPKAPLPSKSDGREEWNVVSLLQPNNSSSPEANVAMGNQITISMDRRPSNVSLMCTAPSPAIPLRLRSFSQPGKRPSLLSFIADKTPPVPSSPIRIEPLQPPSSRPIPRQSSSPLINSPLAQSGSPDQPASRSSSFISSSSPLAHTSTTSSLLTEVPTARPDIQHSSTSTAVYGIQPYAHATLSAGSVHVGGLAPAGVLPAYPKSASRRPFHLMRQISTSISTGAYVSPRLYVPRQMWYQTQVKLHGLETKIKLMDTLLAGLELVERDGGVLVGGVDGSMKDGANWDMGGDGGRQTSSAAPSSRVLNATERFMKRLEIFEELLDTLQSGGAKKLGLHSNGPNETAYGQDAMRKGAGFGTLMAHKLGKGLDRITQRSNTDLPTSYIETIARLFEKSQAIDVHLASLEYTSRSHSHANKTGGGAGLYSSIGQQSKQHIEGRLRRVSEFYSTVVCRFVVADMGVLLDKYVKRGGNWCGD